MSKWAAFMFQMAFVGKTINIMSGGASERVRIIPLSIFAIVMGGLIYPSVVNISWGADFLASTILDINMYDLAGSTVIHSTGGWALLAAIIIIGPRRNRYVDGKIRVIPASNIPLVVLGTFLLWIGWFGFNGGSVGSISSVESANTVAKTIMNTNTAGLAGALIAGVLMYARYKLFDITMILNGALGGLVAVTAGPDLYDVYTPIFIGLVGGALVVFAVPLFDKLKLDDPVGALSVHLINGIWGTLAVAIFVSDELKVLNNITFIGQLKGVILIAIFVFSTSFAVLFIINKISKFRAEDDAQIEGMDINECGVEAYPEFKRAI